LLLGLLDRPTVDLDVVAHRTKDSFETSHVLPASLLDAISDVARLHGLPEDWLNSQPADLFRLGMPEGYEQRLTERQFGGLTLQVVGRFDQICFKLQAWVDRYPAGEKHRSDLTLLEPTGEELLRAARWARSHDPSEGFRMGLVAALSRLGVTEPIDV
jgi:hypothetical protein